MRVLHVITLAELGGAQRYVAELARRQAQCGFVVELASGTGGWLAQQPGFARTHMIEELVRPVRPLRDLRAVLQLRRLLGQGRFSVVHTHSSKAGVVGRFAAALSRVPVVAHTSHGTVLGERLGLLQRAVYTLAEKTGALLTTHLFAVSDTERSLLAESLRLSPQTVRVMTLVPGYIRSIARSWRPDPTGCPDLICVANLYHNKGIDVLLEATAILARSTEGTLVTVYGDGPERDRLEAQRRRLGLEERFLMPGRVHDASVRLADGAIAVISSRKEALPFALLEAMAIGAPVVSTDVGAIREVFGGEVPLARPNDPEDLARLLVDVVRSEKRRSELAAAGRQALERLVANDRLEAACGMYA